MALQPGSPEPAPLAPPKFTLADVRRAIPAHCFEHSLIKSFAYLALDLFMVACLGFAAWHIDSLPGWAKVPAWLAYWFAQGVVMTGVWVLAHECGHGGFAASSMVNNIVGWVLHSALLVPFHSWQISHANHHKNTCSMEHDEVFIPSTRSAVGEMISESPLVAAFEIFNMLLFGWPGYLIFNAAGPQKYKGVANSHFNPSSKVFTAKQWWSIVWSDVGFFLAVAAIIVASNVFGFSNVAFYYGVPYLVVNAFLVLITYLQHTATYIPHYREPEFTWLRGALSTVDRSFGPLDFFLHHIADTHVCHHIFSRMPFYNAQEATAHLKRVLGPYYLADSTPIPQALWHSWKYCKFVEDEGDIVHFKRQLSE